MRIIRDRIDAFLGRGAYGTAVPVMDGPLRPNSRLEDAPVLFEAPEVDNLVPVGDGLLFSSGASLMRWTEGGIACLKVFDRPICSLSAGPGDSLAIGLDGAGVVLRGGPYDGHRVERLGDLPLVCPTATLFLDADTLLIAAGAEDHPAAAWKHDLMSLGRSGRVWTVNLSTGRADCLAEGLGYPNGLAREATGDIIVSEAWAHRLIRIGFRNTGAPEVLLDDLPAYPARLSPASEGGYWLALFVPRNQLVEFILREPEYRRRMMAQVEPRYWVAPALSSGWSFKEPLQGGSVKQMGVHKPWAPVWSYGLVIRLDADFLPRASFHSRADGRRHGVCSAVEHQGRLLAASRGAGKAVSIDVRQEGAA